MPSDSSHPDSSKNHQVVDFNEVRTQRMDEKRRKTERILFNNIMGVYSVSAHDQMQPVEMVDVSETGCSFQIPFRTRAQWPTDVQDLTLRLYFSQDTYLPIVVRVQNSRVAIDRGGERFQRFGCLVDNTLSSYGAYLQFVRFLKLYAEHAHKDLGDVTLFYL